MQIAKQGNRYAVLEPVAMGLRNIYGVVGEEVDRKPSLRMESGTQCVSEPFRNQLRFLDIEASQSRSGRRGAHGSALRIADSPAVHPRRSSASFTAVRTASPTPFLRARWYRPWLHPLPTGV